MDIVSELAARATSYIILLQDALTLVPAGPTPPLLLLPASEVPALCAAVWDEPILKKKAQALLDSATGLPEGPSSGLATETAVIKERTWFDAHVPALLAFLQQELGPLLPVTVAVAPPPTGPRPFRRILPQPTGLAATAGVTAYYLAPETWRQALQHLLYQRPASRVALAEALDYLPTLVYKLIDALVVGPPVPFPVRWGRKVWQGFKNVQHLFEEAEDKPPRQYKRWADYLQLSNTQLAEELRLAELPVPFELMFSQELAEISLRRATVVPAAPTATVPAASASTEASAGPFGYARALELCALALSGGGIRTATFNLGLLQGLAGAGWLPRFDYLSTVSGGGYLGSWLTAWIKREGSLAKVTARLCPGTAPLPQADEVRPIRWLRMYSNYLAPKTGGLTADSWTLGATWLRNTLLNQLIIVLALGAVLALGSAALYGWFWLSWDAVPHLLRTQWRVAAISAALLGPAAWLAGVGMGMFRPRPVPLPIYWTPAIRLGLQFLALVGAYLASGFLYKGPYGGFGQSCLLLWPVAAVTTAALVWIAWAGRYDHCFYRRPEGHKPSTTQYAKAWSLIILTSLLAAGAGLVALVGVWKLLSSLQCLHETSPPDFVSKESIPLPTDINPLAFYPQALLYGAFILGVPLVLEALVVAVVTRMALLGRNFPDERREWWGRMGAVLHRATLVWVLFASSPLLTRSIARLVAHLSHADVDTTAAGTGLQSLVTALITGGWLALVGKAVRLAFSSRTRAKADAPGATTSWLDQVLGLAPYVFGLGLLVLTQGAVYWLLHYWMPAYTPYLTSWPADQTKQLVLRSALLAVGLGGAALLLGWRVGVNEFSLHHFYRNRLVRAYLGASRFRFDRERTANPFTGFDNRDNVKLCSLQHSSPLPDEVTNTPYDGPFLLINATLNTTSVSDLAQQDRQAESFVFTPLYCGFDFARIRALDPTRQNYSFGYRPTRQYAYSRDNGPGVGTAMAISGAAANPNEGYHSSPATAFLLTLFNVRLGWWMGNPRNENTWKEADPGLGMLYLFKDLLGRSDTSDRYVNLSDGGHFDNMGLYELVRRRCRYIVLGDGEEDHLFSCDGLANAIRRCRVDFGVEITIDVTPITTRPAGYSRAHYAVGTIHYPGDAPGQPTGRLLYLKTSLTNDEPTDVREYAQYNKAFPHQSTGDQFFNEAQFESYRRLGLHVFETLAQRNPLLTNPTASLADIFKQLK